MVTIQHKRGDTFSYAGTVPLPTASWTGAAQIRRNDTLVDDLVVTVTAPQAPATEYGVLLEATDEQTELWPIATLLCDVQFTDPATDFVISTVTFQVKVVKDVTYAEPV